MPSIVISIKMSMRLILEFFWWLSFWHLDFFVLLYCWVGSNSKLSLKLYFLWIQIFLGLNIFLDITFFQGRNIFELHILLTLKFSTKFYEMQFSLTHKSFWTKSYLEPNFIGKKRSSSRCSNPNTQICQFHPKQPI